MTVEDFFFHERRQNKGQKMFRLHYIPWLLSIIVILSNQASAEVTDEEWCTAQSLEISERYHSCLVRRQKFSDTRDTEADFKLCEDGYSARFAHLDAQARARGLSSCDAPISATAERMRLLEGLNPAIDRPYFWAWEKFVEINSPGLKRQRPEDNQKFDTVWEGWATDNETFPDCPSTDEPPLWPGNSYRGKPLNPRRTFIDGADTTFNWYTMEDGVPTAVSAVDPQEVRRNKASFDYIVGHGLYYTEGLAQVYADAESAVYAVGGDTARSMQAVLDVIDFPIEAIEIKADWIPIEDIPEAQRDDYYRNWTVDDDGDASEYALVAMHIMTKDLPFWFWATFNNKHVLGRCDYIGCRDDFGRVPSTTLPNDDANYPYAEGEVTAELKTLMESAKLDEVFQNYRLIGVQTDFTDPTGQPTIFSNTITEQDQLQTSSCITCHSRAAVQSGGSLLSVLSDEAQSQTPPSGDVFVTDNGTPDPSWYWVLDYDTDYFSTNTKVSALTAAQLDFVWGFINAASTDCSSSD